MIVMNPCCCQDNDIPVVCCFIPPNTVRFKNTVSGPGDDGLGWYKWVAGSQGQAGVDVDFHKYIWDEVANGVSFAAYMADEGSNPPPGLTNTMNLMHNCTGGDVCVLNGCTGVGNDFSLVEISGGSCPTGYLLIPWTVFETGDGQNKWLSVVELVCTESHVGDIVYSFDPGTSARVRLFDPVPSTSVTVGVVSPFDTIGMFQGGPFAFDGGNPYVEWDNDTSPEWAAARLPAEGCPDYSDLTLYDATPCEGTSGGVKHIVLNNATLDGTVHSGTIGADTGCWTLTEGTDPPDDMPTLTPEADCEAEACAGPPPAGDYIVTVFNGTDSVNFNVFTGFGPPPTVGNYHRDLNDCTPCGGIVCGDQCWLVTAVVAGTGPYTAFTSCLNATPAGDCP